MHKLNNIRPNSKFIFIFFCVISSGLSCTKFVQVGTPPNQLLNATVFTDNGSANSTVTGIYGRMVLTNGFISGGSIGLNIMTGLSADEFHIVPSYFYSSDLLGFETNNLTASNSALESSLWAEPYQYIYSANAILEGLANSNGVTDSIKRELSGEAKFIRAFCYFYITNLFGDVPLITTTNYKASTVAVRSPSAKIYDQIISDLKDAQISLRPDYSVSNGERVRPNQSAATALLARVYLYLKDWSDAENMSSQVIENSLYSLKTDLNQVFLANSTEAIWQLFPESPNTNALEGQTFILTAAPSIIYMTDSIVNAFEPNDLRFINWVGKFSVGTSSWYFPFKYKVQSSAVLTEYSMILRLAEQYLIRSEARAQQINIVGSQSDLNAVRSRAGLGNTTANDKESLLSTIMHERQIELFSELGHRWLDLKRNDLSVSVLAPVKGPTFQSTDTLYPIPQLERQNNPNITQNLGY